VLSLGKVRLDKNMKEVPGVEEESQMDSSSLKAPF